MLEIVVSHSQFIKITDNSLYIQLKNHMISRLDLISGSVRRAQRCEAWTKFQFSPNSRYFILLASLCLCYCSRFCAFIAPTRPIFSLASILAFWKRSMASSSLRRMRESSRASSMILPRRSSARMRSLQSLLLRLQSSGSQGMFSCGTSTSFSSPSSLIGTSPLFCRSFSISSKISIRNFSSSCSFSVELPISDGSRSVCLPTARCRVSTLAARCGLGLGGRMLISLRAILSWIHSATALGSTFFFSWLRMAMIFFLVSARFSYFWQVAQRQSWLIWCVRSGMRRKLTISISSFMHSMFCPILRLCSATRNRSSRYSFLSSADRYASCSNTGISFRSYSAVSRFILCYIYCEKGIIGSGLGEMCCGLRKRQMVSLRIKTPLESYGHGQKTKAQSIHASKR